MKITKQRLKAIIKEELAEADIASIRADLDRPPGEPRPSGEEQRAATERRRRLGDEARLRSVATTLGAGPDFAEKIKEGIMNAVASEGMGYSHSLNTILDALESLGATGQ